MDAKIFALTKKPLKTENYPTRALAVWGGISKIKKGTAEAVGKAMDYKGSQDRTKLAAYFLKRFVDVGAVEVTDPTGTLTVVEKKGKTTFAEVRKQVAEALMPSTAAVKPVAKTTKSKTSKTAAKKR